ncbi:hypothetical protein F4810DRAFT_682419 [Camillea tinctor]|nr:hypothetical protein F4810DRAFT_682419 [Camillea tinctor]
MAEQGDMGVISARFPLTKIPLELQVKVWATAAEDHFRSLEATYTPRLWMVRKNSVLVYMETFGRLPQTPTAVANLHTLLRPLLETNRLSREIAQRFLCLFRVRNTNGYVMTVPRADAFLLDAPFLNTIAAFPEFSPQSLDVGSMSLPLRSVIQDYHRANVHKLTYIHNVVVPGGIFETPHAGCLSTLLRMPNLRTIYIDVSRMCLIKGMLIPEPPSHQRSRSTAAAGRSDSAPAAISGPVNHPCYCVHRWALCHHYSLSTNRRTDPALGEAADHFSQHFVRETTYFQAQVSEASPLRAEESSYVLTPVEAQWWKEEHTPISGRGCPRRTPHVPAQADDGGASRPHCVMLVREAWKGPVRDSWSNFARKGVKGAAVLSVLEHTQHVHKGVEHVREPAQ